MDINSVIARIIIYKPALERIRIFANPGGDLAQFFGQQPITIGLFMVIEKGSVAKFEISTIYCGLYHINHTTNCVLKKFCDRILYSAKNHMQSLQHGLILAEWPL